MGVCRQNAANESFVYLKLTPEVARGGSGVGGRIRRERRKRRTVMHAGWLGKQRSRRDDPSQLGTKTTSETRLARSLHVGGLLSSCFLPPCEGIRERNYTPILAVTHAKIIKTLGL